MRFIADFYLESDLCLGEGAGPLTYADPAGRYSLAISNAAGDKRPARAVLCAQLVFEAKELRPAAEAAPLLMADALNFLVLSTNHMFRTLMLRRVVDWTPGTVNRRALIFAEVDEREEAIPIMVQPLVDSAMALAAVATNPAQHAAMRWYRLGVQAGHPDEQFSYFWFALEIAAEAMKGSEKVAHRCPHCKGDLFCPMCSKTPMHRRYPGEAIGQVIERVLPKRDEAREVHDTLSKVRHTLMHGGRIGDAVINLPCDEAQAVNTLASITWHAIGTMSEGSITTRTEPIQLIPPENMLRRRLIGSAEVQVAMDDPNEPSLDAFPSIDLTVTVKPFIHLAKPPSVTPPAGAAAEPGS